ncbi:MAG TPA: N-acetylmuramoyl-L-alanine amidase [Vicinamibacterales bacterium]
MASPQSRLLIACVVVLLAVASIAARQATPIRAALPLTVISQEGRRPLAAVLVGDQVMVALDDLAALFQLAIRDDTLGGAVTVGYKGKAVILTPGQALASAGGRLVSLPAPVTRDGRRWLVPVEFISRALGPIFDARLDVRKNSRLVLVGDVRVPRISVREDVLGPQTRVTFEMTPRTPHTITQEAGHLLVRFDSDALDVSLPATGPQGLVQAVRIADPNTTIAIDVGPRFGAYRASLTPQEGNASQLIVDIMPAGSEPVSQPPGRPPAPAPTVPSSGPDQQAAPAASPVSGGLRTVVLDPGHGGDETGAKGAGGVLEKDVALGVARRLKAALEGRLGVRVLLTRDGDQAVPLDDRAALANNNKADLFLSIHANASVRKEVSGAQIYYLAADQSGEDARTSAATHQALPTLGGGTREIEMILWEMAQLRHLTESALLAGAVEEQCRGRVRLNVRPVQQAPFRVLAGANMPAVLVEVGFVTNPDEEQQLGSDAYQNTLAQALFDGVVRFRDRADRAQAPPVPPLPIPAPASVVKDPSRDHR